MFMYSVALIHNNTKFSRGLSIAITTACCNKNRKVKYVLYGILLRTLWSTFSWHSFLLLHFKGIQWLYWFFSYNSNTILREFLHQAWCQIYCFSSKRQKKPGMVLPYLHTILKLPLFIFWTVSLFFLTLLEVFRIQNIYPNL